MVAINFPDSPTNGQEHSGYVWDATNNVWNRLPTLPALDLVNFSAVAPSNPQDGQFWFDTTAGKMYVYYNDGSSAQWVSTLGGLVGQTGTEGQQLIHNGTEWVAYDGKSRNLIYNGAMQVAQRGTSATGLTNGSSGYKTADRWQWLESGAPTFVVTNTIEADGPTGSGFTKSNKFEITTAQGSLAAADRMRVVQGLEGQDLQGLKKGTSSAESLTVSFWVKSNVTGTYIVTAWDVDNSRHISASYTVSSSGTWEKKTITFAGDTTGAFDNDNAASFYFVFYLAAGTDYTSGSLATSWASLTNANEAVGQTNLAASTSNYWQITGVQLETGTVSTPFEHKSYSTELAECQRYYQRFGGNSVYGISGLGFAPTTGTCNFIIDLPVQMRTAPTSLDAALLSISDLVSVAVTVYTLSIAATTTTRSTASLYATNSPVTQFRPYVLTNNNSVDGYLGLSAEL